MLVEKYDTAVSMPGDKYRRYRCRPTYNTIKPPHLVAACLS